MANRKCTVRAMQLVTSGEWCARSGHETKIAIEQSGNGVCWKGTLLQAEKGVVARWSMDKT